MGGRETSSAAAISGEESLRLLRWLLGYTRRWRWMMLWILLLTAAAGLGMNYPPVLIRNAVDRWIAVPELPMDARMRGLLETAALFLAVSAGSLLLRYAQTVLTARMGQRIVRDIREDVFGKALGLHLRYFDTTPVGRLMTRVTSDVDSVQGFVSDGVVGAVADVFQVAGVFVFMVYISPVLSVVLFSMVPFLVAAFVFANRRVRVANREIRRAQSALNTQAQETLTGLSTIQLFGRESTMRARFARLNRLMRDAHFAEVRWFSFYFPVLELTQAVATMLVLGVGGWCIVQGRGGVTLGVLIAFLSYVRDFFRPLDGLSNRAGSLQQALAACERIVTLLEHPNEVRDAETPVALPPGAGAVEFDHVDFAYAEGNPVLRDVSFRIEAGETVAVVGATGAGKTTLVNLLMRFYDVCGGSVRVGGVDVREAGQVALRRRLGVVRQEPFVFSATVAENISMMDAGMPREVIEEAARLANAERFIGRLPDGFDTRLNERGAGLSAGQKQLLALARVLAHNREALLVLDEATANVDSETEALIQEALRRVMAERTGIVIAHRLSTIRHADRILVFQHGRLVAQGGHEELLRQDGYYRRLYEYLMLQAEGGGR